MSLVAVAMTLLPVDAIVQDPVAMTVATATKMITLEEVTAIDPAVMIATVLVAMTLDPVTVALLGSPTDMTEEAQHATRAATLALEVHQSPNCVYLWTPLHPCQLPTCTLPIRMCRIFRRLRCILPPDLPLGELLTCCSLHIRED